MEGGSLEDVVVAVTREQTVVGNVFFFVVEMSFSSEKSLLSSEMSSLLEISLSLEISLLSLEVSSLLFEMSSSLAISFSSKYLRHWKSL